MDDRLQLYKRNYAHYPEWPSTTQKDHLKRGLSDPIFSTALLIKTCQNSLLDPSISELFRCQPAGICLALSLRGLNQHLTKIKNSGLGSSSSSRRKSLTTDLYHPRWSYYWPLTDGFFADKLNFSSGL